MFSISFPTHEIGRMCSHLSTAGAAKAFGYSINSVFQKELVHTNTTKTEHTYPTVNQKVILLSHKFFIIYSLEDIIEIFCLFACLLFL